MFGSRLGMSVGRADHVLVRDIPQVRCEIGPGVEHAVAVGRGLCVPVIGVAAQAEGHLLPHEGGMGIAGCLGGVEVAGTRSPHHRRRQLASLVRPYYVVEVGYRLQAEEDHEGVIQFGVGLGRRVELGLRRG